MSNRKSVLAAIAAHGTATAAEIDDLSGLGITKIRFTIGDLKKVDLIEGTKDDVTNTPAYKLTPAGVKWLKDQTGTVEDTNPLPVKAVKALEKNGTSLAEDCHRSHPHEDMSEHCQRISNLEDDVRRQAERATAAESSRDDLRNELDQANSANENWRALAGEYECKSIPELRVFIESALDRINKLLDQPSGDEVDASLPGESVDVKEAAIGYLIRVKGKRSLIRSKPEGAHAAAMSSAKAHGRADVLALVPVGKAVRGAEWVQA